MNEEERLRGPEEPLPPRLADDEEFPAGHHSSQEEDALAEEDAKKGQAGGGARRWGWGRLAGHSAGAVTLLALLLAGVLVIASSAWFQNVVRRRVVNALEDATGGRVEIGSLRWQLFLLRVEADDITIHGLEPANEEPYAHVNELEAKISVLELLSPGIETRVLLREARIVRPTIHLMVMGDGSTNQPHPKHPSKPGRPVIDTLFDAEIGRLSVEQGRLHIVDQLIPLDLRATNTNVQLKWISGGWRKPDSYRVQVILGDLAMTQGKFEPVPSRLALALTLFRDRAELDSLQLESMGKTITVRGKLESFRHPTWQANADGDVDFRALAPWAGFPFAREGVMHFAASVRGRGRDFVGGGTLSGGVLRYKDPVLDAETSHLSARFRADPRRLVVSDIRLQLAKGGEADGEFVYDDWLETTPKPEQRRELERKHQAIVLPTGRVKASLSGITLDTVLELLAAPKYQRLGLNAVISGLATAGWSGLGENLEIGGELNLTPEANLLPGEVPVTGRVDGTYRVATGSIDLRGLEARLPHSTVTGSGLLGVFPIDKTSAMSVDLKSSDMADFDGVLRVLELRQGKRVGTAALPIRLRGQAEFRGQLSSSWLTPRVEGQVTGRDVEIQMSAAVDAEPRFVHWDAVDAEGFYTPASVTVTHGELKRGMGSLVFDGTLDSANAAFNLASKGTEFDDNALLKGRVAVQQFPLTDLLPLAGVAVPVTGLLNAEVDVSGRLRALAAQGSVDVAKAMVYGQAVDHMHAAGSVTGQRLQLTAFTATDGEGLISGTGSYDAARKSFVVDGEGVAIDVGRIALVRDMGVLGKLTFAVKGAGSLDDPRLDAKATLSSIRIYGEPMADVKATARSRDRAVEYDLSSRQEAGQVAVHGRTALNADYTTEAGLDFSHFNLGAVLKMAKVTGINGESDMDGTARLSGPLAHPEKLDGEATVREVKAVVEGVHLASKGSVHAVLSKGVARIDPVEITGEDTDLKLQGNVALAGSRQMDVRANGSVNMRLVESMDADLIASGATNFQVEAHGPLSNPVLEGRVEFQNSSIALKDFPNGLSQIKGSLEFIGNRLEVRSLTATSGGGQLSVGGFIGFQRGLFADLTATGKSIRIRYPQGVSSLADATMRLQGPQNNLLLSGNVVVTRFAINSDLDLSSFTSSTAGVQAIVSPDSPSNHVRLDVHLTSAAQLNFQNALAKLAGDVDLRVRGTLASPSVLGRISLTEGNATFGGTQYELQRGDISFNNPVRIQPNIDLDATARVEDYDITLGLHGTTDKYNLTYRSEPPLPEADVIALLALGRTQGEQRAYSQTQQQAGDNPMTDALLGGALNATVSNRVQRLFGSGAIKVDPNFIGSLGNSTARVTVVEQIGKNLTFTYASNVNTTTQQLIQAEIAVNRHVSLLVTQDESGIFSIVVKARRRFK